MRFHCVGSLKSPIDLTKRKKFIIIGEKKKKKMFGVDDLAGGYAK